MLISFFKSVHIVMHVILLRTYHLYYYVLSGGKILLSYL